MTKYVLKYIYVSTRDGVCASYTARHLCAYPVFLDIWQSRLKGKEKNFI